MEVPITTDAELEAVYEYSINLAQILPNQDVEIMMHFNNGSRFLTIKDDNRRVNARYDLVTPKKPDDTPVILLQLLSQRFNISMEDAKGLLKAMPEVIEKAQKAVLHS